MCSSKLWLIFFTFVIFLVVLLCVVNFLVYFSPNSRQSLEHSRSCFLEKHDYKLNPGISGIEVTFISLSGLNKSVSSFFKMWSRFGLPATYRRDSLGLHITRYHPPWILKTHGLWF